jgi:GTPase SAR1 family protein
MSVIVIGDKNVGKTSAILTLCQDSPIKNVEISTNDCTHLREKMLDLQGIVAGTEIPINRYTVSMSLNLPRPKDIQVQLIDTRGELWGNIQAQRSPQEVFPKAYAELFGEIRKARYIILLLNPYQELVVGKYLAEKTNARDCVDIKRDLYNAEAWLVRFRKTLDFFDQQCTSAKHIFVCLNKADLFCNYREESERWMYQPFGNNNFSTYLSRIQNLYFGIADEAIVDFNSSANQRNSDSKLSFFIMTKEDRNLSEIPWLILGTNLGIDNSYGI